MQNPFNEAITTTVTAELTIDQHAYLKAACAYLGQEPAAFIREAIADKISAHQCMVSDPRFEETLREIKSEDWHVAEACWRANARCVMAG